MMMDTAEQKQLLEGVAVHYNFDTDFDVTNSNLAARLITPFCRGKDVLEVGAASGEVSVVIQPLSRSLTIVEPVGSFAEKARARLGDQVTLHNCFLEEIVTERKFDTVVLAGILHHIEHPEQFLSCVKKFCHNDTVVLASVPNVTSLHRRLGVKAGLLGELTADTERNLRFQQFQKFDRKSLAALFIRAGYSVLECFGYMLKPFSSDQMIKLNLDESIIDALFQMGREYPELSSQLFLRAAPADQ
jgi:2-polyprenyl-3-methyl-5-hydroxy-6-metoxy-1,4-benzoquinol methylase